MGIIWGSYGGLMGVIWGSFWGHRWENRCLHHRNPSKVLHRVSGAQKHAFDHHVAAFAGHMNWPCWLVVASNREQWKSFEKTFVEWSSTHIVGW